MRKILSSRFLNIGLILLVLILNIFAACEIGLGASVDTEAPTLEISSPPVDSIVRGDFALKGTWIDDGTISSVFVTLKRTDGYGATLEYEATLEDLEDEEANGAWSVIINPVEEGILDGTYEASIEITDEAGHVITQTRIFSIDNTPPLIILQRPGTKITETPDAYGQTFSLNGMGTDDNNIDHIDVAIYSDEECTNLLKTITKSNVPPTIELDVAVFEDGIANDYSEIYGSTTKNGTQTRYCKIIAYDNAVHYPVDPSQASPTDEKGNSTSTYYLYDDIYTGILEEYTITDVYKMLSGTYQYSEKSRSANVISNIRALLAQNVVTKSNFSLNPENNPLFFVNGKDVLRKDGTDFEADDFNISSGEGVVVEISTGLDGISLNAASLRPYLLPCDGNGNPSVANTAENRIYLANAGTGAKSGTSYKFTVEINSTLDYSGKSISIGNTYIFGVEGADQRGNTIIPKNGTYGFKLASNGAAPGLTVTTPSTTISYVGANGSQVVSGVVTCMDGLPTIAIKNGTTAVYSHTFTESEGVLEDGLYHFNFTHTIDYNGVNENSQLQYTIEASLAGLKTTAYKTIIYDKDAPTISAPIITPTAKKYNLATESNVPLAGDYLNGNITLKLSVVDDYDAIETEAADKKPYFEVIEVNNGVETVKPLIVTGPAVVSESSATDKHFITKLINGSFEIDTTQIASGTDTKTIKFKIFAWDRSGNSNPYISSPYIVDQTTDDPVVIPTNAASTSLLYDKKSVRDNGDATRGIDGGKSSYPSGGNISINIIDDDGIASYTITRASYNTNSNPEETAETVAATFGQDYTQDSVGGSTQLTVTYDLPTEAGYYWLKVSVTDTEGKTKVKGPFIVRVTTPAPSILNVTALESDASDAAVGRYVSNAAGAAKTKWKNKIEIQASDSPFYVLRKENTDFVSGDYPVVRPADSALVEGASFGTGCKIVKISDSTEIYDLIEADVRSGNTNITYYYKVIDNNWNPSTNSKSVVCYFDNVAPVNPTITKPEASNGRAVSVSGTSDTFTGSASDGAAATDQSQSKIAKINYAITNSSSAPDSTEWHSKSASDGTWNLNVSLASGSGTNSITDSTISLYEGHYYLHIIAEDAAGNKSAEVCREFYVDQNAPENTLVSPTPAANACLNQNFTIAAQVTDTYGIESVSISTSNHQYETSASGSTYSKQFKVGSANASDASYIADGTYSFVVTATDNAGKTKTQTRTYTIDTVKPQFTSSSLKVGNAAYSSSNYYTSNIQKISGTYADTGSGMDTLYYYVLPAGQTEPTALSSANIASANLSTLLDASNNPLANQMSFASDSHDFSFTIENLSDNKDGAGTKIYLQAEDKAKNLSEVYLFTLNIDTANPAITSSSVNEYYSGSTVVSVTFTGTDDNLVSDIVISVVKGEGSSAQTITTTDGSNGVTITTSPATGASRLNGKSTLSKTVTIAPSSAYDGKYTITAHSTDAANRSSDDKTVVTTIDRVSPVYTSASLKVGASSADWNAASYYKDTTLKITGTYTEATSGMDTIYFYAKASDSQTAAPADLTVTGAATGSANFRAGSNDFSFTVENFKDNTYSNGTSTPNTLYIQAVDKAGNKSDRESFAINVDTSAPELELYRYKVGTGELQAVLGTVFVNSSSTLTLYGNYTDGQSGVQELVFEGTENDASGNPQQPDIYYSVKTAETSAESDYQAYSAISDKKTIRAWKAVLINDKIRTGTLSVKGYNNAGNPGLLVRKDLFAINRDTTAPTFGNVNFTTEAEHFLVYAKKAADGVTVSKYFINNKNGPFIISGLAQDPTGSEGSASGVASVSLTISDNSSHTYTDSSTTAYFPDIDLTDFVNAATAVITVLDHAGNTYTYTLPEIKFDVKGPTSVHAIDPTGKDIMFRIGDKNNNDITSANATSQYGLNWNTYTDTSVSPSVTYSDIDEGAGGKYAGGSFNNAYTQKVRGHFNDDVLNDAGEVVEEGSGIKQVYYKIYDRSNSLIFEDGEEWFYTEDMVNNPTQNAILEARKTLLVEDVISANQYLAPLSTPEYKRVFYNVFKPGAGESVNDPFGGHQLIKNGTPVVERKILNTADGSWKDVKEDEAGYDTATQFYKYWKIAGTTYSFTVPNLNEGCNYLVVVAEDNVGNFFIDCSDPIDHDNNPSTPGRIYSNYSMNVDTTVPVITLNDPADTGIRYTNGSYTVKVAVNDPGVVGVPNSSSGIKSVVLSGNNHEVTCTPTGQNNIWQADVSTLLSNNNSVTISATATDVAENSTKMVVANIFKDITAPTVTIKAPEDALKSQSENDIQVNGMISLSGTAQDNTGGSGLKEESGGSKSLKLYYTTNTSLGQKTGSTITSSDIRASNDTTSTAAQKFIFLDETDNAASWTFTNIDTTALSGTVYFMVSSVDKAGNVGYANPQKVIVDQNTDRPTITFSNLVLGPSMSGAADGYVWLKNTTKIIGTIADDDDADDGTNSMQIKVGDSAWTNVTLNGSSFSFDLKTLYTATSTQSQEAQANGNKTVLFKITDKKNHTFTSAATNTTSALYLSDGTDTYGSAASGVKTSSILYITVDTIYPEVALAGAKYTTAEDTTYTTTYNSLKLGNTNRSFKVRFTATDANGINASGVSGTAELPYGTSTYAVTVNSSNLTEPTATDDFYTLTFTLSDGNVTTLTGYDGSVNVSISATDNAGNVTSKTFSLSYDFKPATASFSSPSSSTHLSGEVEAYGSLSEIASVSYTVSPSQTVSAGGSVTSWLNDSNQSTNLATAKTVEDWQPISDATGLTWTIHFDNNTEANQTTTHAKSLNKYLIDYGIAQQDTSSPDSSDAIVSTFNDFVRLYLWIKTVDNAGNEKTFVHPLLVDPQGDRPNLQFSYPAASNGTLGGDVSIYGTATDTKGTSSDKIGVDSVWVQIKSTTHRAAADTTTYGASPSYNSATDTVSMILTEADLDYMVNNGYQVYKRSSYVVGGTAAENDTHKWTTSRNLASGETADDYAALANLNGAAWDIEINKNPVSGRSEFDPPSGINTNPIAIRVYARDKDGKFSSKQDRYVSFDADTPVISDLKVVQSANGNVTSAATATKTYSQDMFLKSQWYLTGRVTDNDKIKELKVNGQTLVTYTESTESETPTITTATAWTNAVSISADGKTIDFKYPLFVDNNGSVAYSIPTNFTVSAKDAIKGNNAHEISHALSINYDNTAPTVATTVAEGLNIDGSIRQSNRWYTFGSKAMEPAINNAPQSGFAYTAFYFTRNKTLYDVLNARDSSAIGISGTIPNLGSEASTAADNTIVQSNNLYWRRKTITSINAQTIGLSDVSGIRLSSLLQINGAFYLVTSIDGTSVGVDSAVPEGSSVAYVAIAGIINNTNAEGDGTSIQSDGYYTSPSRDDGDRMIEAVDKSGTTWTWEAKICSRNIPDGPVVLHYIVFDKAGNSTTGTVSGMVSNNQPRIAGAIVKTDFNGDGDVDDEGETLNNYATSLSYSNYYTGTKTTGTAPNTVTKNVFDPDENVKNTNAKNPLPTSTTYGEADNPITVLRGKTVIQPEIVGGNGALYYSYRVGGSGDFTDNSTAAFIANGSTDYTVETGNINIQLGDLISFGDTTNATTGKLFEFKFWDSTAGGTRFSSSNPTQVAQLSMYFAVQAQTVGNPSVKINPFYWNSLTDNSIYGSANASSYANLQGHIELEKDWKTTSAYSSTATDGLYDDDPKVSGKIVLSGTAHDDKLIKEMNANIFGTSVALASYSGGALVSTKAESAFATNHYWFEVVSQTINSTGHDVNWKLYVDTATALSTVAGTDKTVTVTATNYGAPTATEVTSTTAGAILSMNGSTYYSGTISYATGNSNTPGIIQTAKTTDAQNNPVLTAYYKMDVVPYITKISTGIRTASGLKDSNIRSAIGKYSILANTMATASQNAITVSGFNFYGTDIVAKIANSTVSAGTGITKDSGGVGLTISASSTSTATIANVSITKSGYLELFSNGVRALNNVNQNNAYGTATKKVSNVDTQITAANAVAADYEDSYNREPDYYTTKNVLLTDDRYLRFFDMKNTGVKNGYYPVMIMNGDNPVFGYVNKSGGTSGTASVGNNTYAGSYNASHAMPQRSEFNGADGTRIDTEYLIKASTWDQMGMAVDEGGRYYNVSVYNRDGAAMSLIYDRYNEIETPSQGYGWGAGTGYQGYTGSYSYYLKNNAITLEKVNYGGSLLTERFQYPKLIAKGDSTSDTENATIYMTYYDDATGEILFRDFRIGTEYASTYEVVKNDYSFTRGNYTGYGYLYGNSDDSLGNTYVKIGQDYYLLTSIGSTGSETVYRIEDYENTDTTISSDIYIPMGLDNNGTDSNSLTYNQGVNFIENYNNSSNYDNGRLSVVSTGSKYFDMGVTSDNHVVIAYVDSVTNNLVLKYSTNAIDGSNPVADVSWTTSTVSFPDNIGTYVSIALDGNAVHMAAFDGYDSNLVYMYLPSYNSPAGFKKVTVDQASAVGNWTQVKVKDGVPYIAYYNSTETGGRDCIKLAYPVATTGKTAVQNKENPGVDVEPGTAYAAGGSANGAATGYTTGAWEYMTVPAITPPQGGDPKFQNVCLDFDSAGRPVVGYLGTNLEFGKALDE